MPKPPEMMLPLITEVRDIMSRYGVDDKPLWNTETGWYIVGSENQMNQGVIDEETAAAYIARSFLLNRSAGVERLYWYAWDNGKMGLASPDGQTLKKEPVAAYNQIVNWLTGAKLTGCGMEPDGNWICRLEQAEGGEAYILWNPQMGGWQLPEDWQGAMVTDLLGRRWKLPRRSLAVGSSPVLLERMP
jgi:hypothetical protein